MSWATSNVEMTAARSIENKLVIETKYLKENLRKKDGQNKQTAVNDTQTRYAIPQIAYTWVKYTTDSIKNLYQALMDLS